MAFIDDLTFHIKAGNGGQGVVRWRHEKGKDFAGAAGGNGGKGGDVYVRAIRDLSILARYRNIKKFESEKGEDGMRNSMHGKDGKDLIIDIPIGSVITDSRTSRQFNLLNENDKIMILKGGHGGLGNEHFKASTNVTPKESTPGKPGEEADFHIELELVADAGFVGLPNAGKSSLLNALTNARAEVGSYAFTTLEPNLGALSGGFILADIPGLIEGASEGKGLGHKFLRHIKRTKRILHLISLESDTIVDAYKTIRDELKKYGEGLDDKEETIIFTKTDMIDEKEVQKAIKKLNKYNKDILAVTVLDDDSIKKLSDEIVKRLRK
ncbi:MAG: Obg family GTPase CgtA [Patescibacteria group bacterium]